MTLTQEQIKKIAEDLSKLPVQDEKSGEDMNKILQYVELLNQVDTTGVEPTVSITKKTQSLRKDELKTDKDTTAKELLACSKQKVIQNQIAVSSIM